MDLDTYAVEAKVEGSHWWFTGRRRLFMQTVETHAADRAAPVLDVGSSTGATVRALLSRGYSKVSGLEFSPTAIEFCRKQGLHQVQQGDVTAMPFGDRSFEFRDCRGRHRARR